jgi:hypothetical protein
MKLEGTHTAIAIWVFGVLAAVAVGPAFVSFLVTRMERYSLPFGAILGIIFAIVWVYGSGKYWWLVFPVMALWGGLFWVGFRIYPDEFGLVIAAAALAVALCTHYQAIVRDRSPASWGFLLLCLYFLVHLLSSLSNTRLGWLSGGGSIVRVYASGITCLVFSWMYYKFGSSEHIKLAVIILFMVMLVRIVISMLALYTPVLYGISEAGFLWLNSSSDLRFSALYQMLFGIMLFYLFKGRWTKAIIIVFIIGMFILVLFGEGRVSVAMAVSTLILWMLLARKTILLVYLLPLLIVCIVLVYSEVHLLSQLPPGVQRAMSFIPGLESQLIYNTGGSDDWHFDLLLLGYQRWTSSFASLIFGNCINPEGVYSFAKLDYLSKLEIAAGTSRYECTLWSVLATLGIVGTALYVWIFTFLFREIIPIVRREGIISFNHAVYAAAIISLLLMILFGWIRGGFPGIEMMLGVMAKALYEDSKSSKQQHWQLTLRV